MKKLNRITAQQPSTRPVKVLQFGDGNFLRGFADWIIDILNEKTDFNGDVQLIRPLRKGAQVAHDNQDGLFHVVVNGLQHGRVISETRLITCVAGAIDPYQEGGLFRAAACNRDLQIIISNTTEAGIAFDADDKSPEIMPASFPGKVTLLLLERFRFFNGDPSKGIAFLPCELIEKNGDTLKEAVLKYAALWNAGKDFVSWINQHNTFCNSLVDRIVPGFPKDRIDEIQRSTGFEDQRVVSVEPFYLWVIEANATIQAIFPVNKTTLAVGFARDLTPYRTRKVRILNGAHTALVPVAYLKGLRTVKQSMDDDTIRSFIREAIFSEIIPTLDLPQEELHQFAEDVLERFQNPFVQHELKSIALNSISKFRVRVLPTILEHHRRKGFWPDNLLHSFAALIAFYRGNWKDEIIPLNDSPEILTFFRDAWQQAELAAVVGSVLSKEVFWGENLNILPGLGQQVTKHLAGFVTK